MAIFGQQRAHFHAYHSRITAFILFMHLPCGRDHFISVLPGISQFVWKAGAGIISVFSHSSSWHLMLGRLKEQRVGQLAFLEHLYLSI